MDNINRIIKVFLLSFPAFYGGWENSLSAQELISLDMQPELDNGTYGLFEEKGYWDQTYNTAVNVLSFGGGMFNFSHIPGQFGGDDVGGGMSYWDGFTVCTSGDTTDYGEKGSSDGWISQQWGCMAGGGLNQEHEVEKGKPYLVAYWGYYYGTVGTHSCQLSFDGKTHRIKGIWLGAHPWPYYGNIHGDGFAGGFYSEGDNYTVCIHGMQGGEDTGSSVTVTMAVFKDGVLVQSPDWQYIDLEPLGEVDAVYFTMTSTDSDPLYGMNTACYFCIGGVDIYVHEESKVPGRPSGLATSDITENEITLSWTADELATEYVVYIDGKEVGVTASTSYTFTSLDPYTEYTLMVVARNEGGDSDPAGISAKTVDVTAPSAPTELKADVVNYHTANITWNASEDNVAVTRYRIFVNGVQESHPKTCSYTLTGLDAETVYTVEVDATDTSGNVSEKTSVTFTTPADPATGINAQCTMLNAQLVYTIPGKRIEGDISSLPSGVYIINGKKYIKR